MNPLSPIASEAFRTGTDRLKYFNDRLVKLNYGVILYCTKGEAEIMIDLQKYPILSNTHVIILPGSILSLLSSNDDFVVDYFVFRREMMEVACLRLEPAFMHFLKEVSCYTDNKADETSYIHLLIKAGKSVYAEKENRFRDQIAQNLLQIYFLGLYDKIQRFFNEEEEESSNRKAQLFKKFIRLVQLHCVTQRDVSFYANELCISTRYLLAITKAMGKNSAKEIIDEFLMLELRVALQSTNLSLKEIAERYQFSDQSFFGRYFKKHTGMSPKEYRNKYVYNIRT